MIIHCTTQELIDKLKVLNAEGFEFKLLSEVPSMENCGLIDYIVDLCSLVTSEDDSPFRISFEYLSPAQPCKKPNGMLLQQISNNNNININVCSLIFQNNETVFYKKSQRGKLIKGVPHYRYFDENFDYVYSTDFFHVKDLYNQYMSAGDEPTYIIPNQLIPTLA